MPIRLTQNLGPVSSCVATATVTLGWQERQRSRLAVVLSNGETAAILLQRGEPMRNGDLLASDDGFCVEIQSAAEIVLEVTSSSALTLMRIAYHFGNRHTPLMLSENAIWIESDAVRADLARRLGGDVKIVSLAFDPEAGPYQGGIKHNHESHDLSDSHGNFIAEDFDFGNLGEVLSRQAHAGKTP